MTRYRNALTVAAMAVWLAAPLAAQKPDPAQAALKAAIDKEMVDGDLKGAIALYEKTVAASRTDRATAAKAEGLGGGLIVPPTDIPNVGRFAVIRDPQGAVFSVITLSQRV